MKIIDQHPQSPIMPCTRINVLLVSILLGGCASTGNYNPKDPFEPVNRGIYKFNDTVDRAVIKPVAKAYNAVMPEPAKNMVTNFFSNLDDVIVTLNDLLQLKFAQAASDGTRFVFNSTFGIFGLFNITDSLEKHNEDFGQTLGYWGIGSGPYIVLPFLGPSSVRDGVGVYGDSQASVTGTVDHIPTRNQMYATKIVSMRAGLLKQEKVFEEAAAIDRYAFIRDAYLQRRQNLVYDGDPPREKLDDDEYIDESDDSAGNDGMTNLPPAAAEPVAPVSPDNKGQPLP